ncbi:MAG: N-acetyltransferase family protein [Erysipelotrichaceae bacterium]
METKTIRSGKTILLRKAIPEDAVMIVDYLKKVCVETDNLSFGLQDMPITVESEIEYLTAIQTSTKSVHFVVLCDDEVIATSNISGKSRPRMAHVASLGISVLRDYWHNGVGSLLMKAMVDWAKAGGVIRKINLSVRSDNQVAIALYRKFGFRYVGTLHDEMRVDGQSVDLDEMELLF